MTIRNITIRPVNLVTIRFSPFFCVVVETKNMNQIFSMLWSGKEKYFCFLL